MPITLIVEDGTIVVNANTYVSLEEATAYLEIDPRFGPLWTGMPDDEKRKQMLVFATRWLDENYQWYGRQVEKTQALRWPRYGMNDGEYCVPSCVIPTALKHAVAMVAVWLFVTDPEEASNSVGIKRFRNDTIEIEWQDNFSGQSAAPKWLSRLLRVFGVGPGDRGFKPIVRTN
ncbi:DnaT-like ssDNA-binding protein [Mesorhizobium sp. M8A.F.Ca.ET.021.01.1.1]|uniref:DnaT-like ssDNA-binding protein n=1 Tax=Mesorhizobium sp. M8A.F.Ca.ET.021.01.1.1 TaxID=2496757 RepID=UPI000FCB99AF|nr:DnaT-like ssDNA-binding protein [Mesorhizobium sp. M8A.F.Ca.ET.021.01.1.1]RUW56737.1 hypothetical protein EOA36_02820 [Mesorhizobium sp. M8A.F.Ca.ET.021.01.1.1]